MANKHWIQKSVPSSHQGVFAEKAKAAGMSTAAYARKEYHAPGKLGAEAREAAELMHLNPNETPAHRDIVGAAKKAHAEITAHHKAGN